MQCYSLRFLACMPMKLHCCNAAACDSSLACRYSCIVAILQLTILRLHADKVALLQCCSLRFLACMSIQLHCCNAAAYDFSPACRYSCIVAMLQLTTPRLHADTVALLQCCSLRFLAWLLIKTQQLLYFLPIIFG